MSNFKNLTPHEIIFFRTQDTVPGEKGVILLKEGAKPSFSVKSSGLARASTVVVDGPMLKTGEGSVPTVYTQMGAPEGLPEEVGPDDVIIVSFVTAEAAKAHNYVHLNNLYTIYGGVRDSAGHIVGCTSLNKVVQ
ncbi:MAG: hypothetical protein J5934_07715 [Succinivibrio sp.]|nr:hypothetical protein [Succinivibrio sp.]